MDKKVKLLLSVGDTTLLVAALDSYAREVRENKSIRPALAQMTIAEVDLLKQTIITAENAAIGRKS